MSNTSAPASELENPPPQFFGFSPPDFAATSNSSLFTLPIELRDRIYDFLWTRTVLASCGTGYCLFHLSYGRPPPMKTKTWKEFKKNASKLPPWIFTSKQLMVEAMQQFYRKASCFYFDQDDDVKIPPMISIDHVKKIAYTLHTSPDQGPILLDVAFDASEDDSPELHVARFYDPDARYDEWTEFEISEDHAREWLRHEILARDEDRDSEDGKRRHPVAVILPHYSVEDDWGSRHEAEIGSGYSEPRPGPDLESLIQVLEGRKHCVKELELAFEPPERLFPPILYNFLGSPLDKSDLDVMSWHVDLSYMERLGTDLDRVEFILTRPDYLRHALQQPQYTDIYIKIQEELERVARRLVGGDAKESALSVRDWIEEHEGIDDDDNDTEKALAWHLEVRRISGEHSKGEICYRGLDYYIRLLNDDSNSLSSDDYYWDDDIF